MRLRVNFVGELGWEFHHPIEQQNALFDLLMDAGKEFGIRPYGIKAMSALSIEKSYRLIPRELSIEYSAYESGLDRFVHPNKGDFIGRDALVKNREQGLAWNFVTLEVQGITDSDARGSEPIYSRGKLIGRATNGGFGWRVNKSLALAMLKPEFALAGTRGRDQDPRQELCGDDHPRKPLRSGQCKAEGLTIALHGRPPSRPSSLDGRLKGGHGGVGRAPCAHSFGSPPGRGLRTGVPRIRPKNT